jgi:hypothetical protein
MYLNKISYFMIFKAQLVINGLNYWLIIYFNLISLTNSMHSIVNCSLGIHLGNPFMYYYHSELL